jgi:hypothetical protein
MSGSIDLDFRPGTYFGPHRLEQYLLSRVKGAVVRNRLKALFAAGRHAEVMSLLDGDGISERDRKALEAMHPMFMGGNYLPDTEQGEVEIARIRIASTTFDVTSVYAKRDGDVIRYRVVDEYGGDTLEGPSGMESDQPLTLGELTDFFLTAWPLLDVLEMNFEGDGDSSLGFFVAESDFYPQFDALCRERVVAHFAGTAEEDGAEAGDDDR